MSAYFPAYVLLNMIIMHAHHVHIIFIGWYGDSTHPVEVDESVALSLDDIIATCQAQSIAIQMYINHAHISDDLPQMYEDMRIASVVVDVDEMMTTMDATAFHHYMQLFGRE